MSVAILGIGIALPQHAIAQNKAAEIAKAFCPPNTEQIRLLPTLYGRTGVRTRGSVLLEDGGGSDLRQSFFPPSSGERDGGPTTQQRMARYAKEALPLARAAARRALAESAVPARRISQLITVSCTGFTAPGVDIGLMKQLGLSPTIGRTHVGFMGCHGSLNATRVASAMVDADPSTRVLICAVELCSLHFHYGWDTEQLVANALFADGGAAMVIGRADAGRGTWRVAAMGSCLFPDSEDAMTWRIGDHGFTMTLSAQVPALLATHLRPWLEHWLARHGLRLNEVASWAIHPGGPRLLREVASNLGLPDASVDVSRQVLAECGNMSSCTILFILDRLRGARARRPCVALGFGPGLVVEAALLR